MSRHNDPASDPNPVTPAADLIAIAPDVIFASPHPAVAAVRKQTTTTPIVAVISGDPIRAGFVQSYARPGGNVRDGSRACEPRRLTLLVGFSQKFLLCVISVTRRSKATPLSFACAHPNVCGLRNPGSVGLWLRQLQERKSHALSNRYFVGSRCRDRHLVHCY
jgi:hypothetical protein